MPRKSIRGRPNEAGSEDEYGVDAIINDRLRPDGVREYYVRWEGKWKSNQHTWQSEDELCSCPKPLQEYQERKAQILLERAEMISFETEARKNSCVRPPPANPKEDVRPLVPRKTIVAPVRIDQSKRISQPTASVVTGKIDDWQKLIQLLPPEQVSPPSRPKTRTVDKPAIGEIASSSTSTSRLAACRKPLTRKTTRAGGRKRKVGHKDIADAQQPQYEVEYIMGVTIDSNDQTRFLVKWKNYGVEVSTWEPTEHVSCAMIKIGQFFEFYGTPTNKRQIILSPEGQRFMESKHGKKSL